MFKYIKPLLTRGKFFSIKYHFSVSRVILKEDNAVVYIPFNENILDKPIVKIYENVSESKLQIIKDMKDIAGIYCWHNRLNKKNYVESSIDIRRFYEYSNITRLILSKQIIE